MKRIQSNPLIISLVIFIVLLSFGILTGGFIVRDRLDHIVYGNRFVQIEGGEYVSEIYSENNNLSTITVHLKNPALENEGGVSFQLYEGESLIREVSFTGKNIGDPGDVKLKFDPISDSAGKSYTAKIIISQEVPKVSIFVDDNDKLGGWYYYRNTTGLSGFSQTTVNMFSKVLSDKIFLFMWVVSLASVSILYIKAKN